MRLPKIYKRDGRECYLDPIRQKLIFITPEETIRQKMISWLIDTLEVPNNMIKIEEPLKHYGLNSKRRADIIIHFFFYENYKTNFICQLRHIFLNLAKFGC